nr:uncharacterized protein LOC123478283 [Desmodus rotundus]
MRIYLCLQPVKGSRGSWGQIKALWTRVTSVLVVHLRALERKAVPTGGLWLLEQRGPLPGCPEPPPGTGGVRAGGGDSALRRGPAPTSAPFPRLPAPGSPPSSPPSSSHHPRSPADPFLHPFPASEKSLVPELVGSGPSFSRSHDVPPPDFATATNSVPLNRFSLHVNTYYRTGPAAAGTCCTPTATARVVPYSTRRPGPMVLPSTRIRALLPPPYSVQHCTPTPLPVLTGNLYPPRSRKTRPNIVSAVP